MAQCQTALQLFLFSLGWRNIRNELEFISGWWVACFLIEIYSQGNDVILEKTKRVNNDIAQKAAEIQEIKDRIDETKGKYLAESTDEPNANLSAVIVHLKK